jgi:hypothetical protein
LGELQKKQILETHYKILDQLYKPCQVRKRRSTYDYSYEELWRQTRIHRNILRRRLDELADNLVIRKWKYKHRRERLTDHYIYSAYAKTSLRTSKAKIKSVYYPPYGNNRGLKKHIPDPKWLLKLKKKAEKDRVKLRRSLQQPEIKQHNEKAILDTRHLEYWLSQMSNYRFVEEEKKEPVILPKRVQILIDDYLAQGRKVDKKFRLEYTMETRDLLEKIFCDRVREKPDSLKVTINALYRVRTDTGEEFYYYNDFWTCSNKLNQPEVFSYEHRGYHKRPIVKMQWEESRATNLPKIVGYEAAFELKWDKNEVRKLLDNSFVPCKNFYLGKAGSKDPIEDRYYQIFNVNDFLNGTWQDLYDMGRLGISYEHESLNLVEAARKQERQNREKAVGMKDPKVYG